MFAEARKAQKTESDSAEAAVKVLNTLPKKHLPFFPVFLALRSALVEGLGFARLESLTLQSFKFRISCNICEEISPKYRKNASFINRATDLTVLFCIMVQTARKLTVEEVTKHNAESDCWLIVKNKVWETF